MRGSWHGFELRRLGLLGVRGRHPDGRYLMLLTSLPAEVWPLLRVLANYRLCWQVELAPAVGLGMIASRMGATAEANTGFLSLQGCRGGRGSRNGDSAVALRGRARCRRRWRRRRLGVPGWSGPCRGPDLRSGPRAGCRRPRRPRAARPARRGRGAIKKDQVVGVAQGVEGAQEFPYRHRPLGLGRRQVGAGDGEAACAVDPDGSAGQAPAAGLERQAGRQLRERRPPEVELDDDDPSAAQGSRPAEAQCQQRLSFPGH